MSKLQYWVYILLCANGSYYTGYTNDLNRRYEEHVSGTGKCKYTRSFKPLCIAQSWCIDNDKSAALRAEQFIKKMTKNQKDMIILHPECYCTVPSISLAHCVVARRLAEVLRPNRP